MTAASVYALPSACFEGQSEGNEDGAALAVLGIVAAERLRSDAYSDISADAFQLKPYEEYTASDRSDPEAQNTASDSRDASNFQLPFISQAGATGESEHNQSSASGTVDDVLGTKVGIAEKQNSSVGEPIPRDEGLSDSSNAGNPPQTSILEAGNNHSKNPLHGRIGGPLADLDEAWAGRDILPQDPKEQLDRSPERNQPSSAQSNSVESKPIKAAHSATRLPEQHESESFSSPADAVSASGDDLVGAGTPQQTSESINAKDIAYLETSEPNLGSEELADPSKGTRHPDTLNDIRHNNIELNVDPSSGKGRPKDPSMVESQISHAVPDIQSQPSDPSPKLDGKESASDSAPRVGEYSSSKKAESSDASKLEKRQNEDLDDAVAGKTATAQNTAAPGTVPNGESVESVTENEDSGADLGGPLQNSIRQEVNGSGGIDLGDGNLTEKKKNGPKEADDGQTRKRADIVNGAFPQTAATNSKGHEASKAANGMDTGSTGSSAQNASIATTSDSKVGKRQNPQPQHQPPRRSSGPHGSGNWVFDLDNPLPLGP